MCFPLLHHDFLLYQYFFLWELNGDSFYLNIVDNYIELLFPTSRHFYGYCNASSKFKNSVPQISNISF